MYRIGSGGASGSHWASACAPDGPYQRLVGPLGGKQLMSASARWICGSTRTVLLLRNRRVWWRFSSWRVLTSAPSISDLLVSMMTAGVMSGAAWGKVELVAVEESPAAAALAPV